MSAAERQRKHREKNREERNLIRINLWLQSDAHHALQNLSRHFDKSKSEVIRELLLKTQGKILDKIHGDDEAWDRYWGINRGIDENEGTEGYEDIVV
jgi:predicted NAD-dependent protein-ADP-ribosyltransferase YbiA (DUF1768 family)